MVWSACVIAPTEEEAAKAAQNGKSFVLRRVRLPCPYRVQMRVTPRMLRFGSERIPERRPYASMDAVPELSFPAPTQSTLPPIFPRTPLSRATTHVRTTTAASDIAFIERAMESSKTRLLFAIKELKDKQTERLAAEQMAQQQLFMRAGEV